MTLSQKVKVHLLLRYCINNLSIGAAYGALLNFFWILNISLNAECPDVERSCSFSVVMGILNIEPKICREV